MKTEIEQTIAPSTCAAIRRALGKWYIKNKRMLPWRLTSDPYAIWVSEAMLQQTQVKTVIPYYLRFMKRFPTAAALAQADQQMVLKAWEGLGYYSRARNLHRAAAMVTQKMNGRMPSEWEVIRQLPGIGDYMAAAILSIAFGQPWAVVDGNVKRVVARLCCLDTAVNETSGYKVFQRLAQKLLDRQAPGDHNQAMMELGALVCTPRNPGCPNCPVAKYCQALKNRAVNRYPKRRKRTPIKEVPFVAGVVVKNGRILLVQRPEHGLLGGLWEFPMVSLTFQDDPVKSLARYIEEATRLTVTVGQHLIVVRHTYTHFKLHMQTYQCRWRAGRVCLNGPSAFHWVSPERLAEFPLHGAVHKILPSLG